MTEQAGWDAVTPPPPPPQKKKKFRWTSHSEQISDSTDTSIVVNIAVSCVTDYQVALGGAMEMMRSEVS